MFNKNLSRRVKNLLQKTVSAIIFALVVVVVVVLFRQFHLFYFSIFFILPFGFRIYFFVLTHTHADNGTIFTRMQKENQGREILQQQAANILLTWLTHTYIDRHVCTMKKKYKNKSCLSAIAVFDIQVHERHKCVCKCACIYYIYKCVRSSKKKYKLFQFKRKVFHCKKYCKGNRTEQLQMFYVENLKKEILSIR